MKRAKTSQHDVPSLSYSLIFVKSSAYHKRSSCPFNTDGGFENADKTISGGNELYPGILDHLPDMNLLEGKRTRLAEVVITTAT